MQIEAKELSYVYSEKSKALAVHALKKVSLTVAEGEFLGIIGQTGSGKSTFIQHLNGLIRVEKDKGSLLVGDFDLTDKKCDLKALRAKVGMVFQYPEYQLFAETVREDVAFALKNFYPELKAEEVEERVRKAVETVGLDYEKIKDKFLHQDDIVLIIMLLQQENLILFLITLYMVLIKYQLKCFLLGKLNQQLKNNKY
jgi:energy-coupling factor transport system ATP-binding protein